jgi:hypothetical protein
MQNLSRMNWSAEKIALSLDFAREKLEHSRYAI